MANGESLTMKYEFDTSYFPLSYYPIAEGEYAPKPLPPVDPNIDFFLNESSYKDELIARSKVGWDLVSVQNILGGCYDNRVATNVAFGYSITAGLMMFWKRQLDE